MSDPDWLALRERRTPIDARAVEGFKYLLGFRADVGKNPLEVGREIYDRAKTDMAGPGKPVPREEDTPLDLSVPATCDLAHGYVGKKEYAFRRADFETCLAKAGLLLRRFDELESYGAYGNDIGPNPLLQTPVVSLYTAAHVRLVEIMTLLHQKRGGEAMAELARLNSFFATSVGFPNHLLATTINLSVLAQIREFLVAALNEYPELKSRVRFDMFVLRKDFESIASDVVFFETAAVSDLLMKRPIDPRWLEFVSLQPEPHKENRYAGPVSWILPLLIKRQKTVNLHFQYLKRTAQAECVKSEAPCENEPVRTGIYAIENPLGRYFLRLLRLSIPGAFEKMWQNWATASRTLSTVRDSTFARPLG